MSREALAAITVGFPVIFLMISFVLGIAIGAGIMIAQYFGAGRKDMVNLTARNFLVIGGISVVFISIIMVALTRPIVAILNTPSEIASDAEIYLFWTFGTLICMFGLNAAAGIFRGLGDSKTPTTVIIWTTVLNTILDPLFIFGTEPIPGIPISNTIGEFIAGITGPIQGLGVAGAAIATAVSNLIGAIIIFIQLASLKEYVSLSFRNFQFDFKIINNILKLGIPTSATMILVSIASMVLMSLVNRHGTSAIAAYGIGFRLDSLIMMPAQSFGFAMSTIAGQNMGAGKKERIYKSLIESQYISGGIGLLVAVILNIFVSPITHAFQPEKEDFKAVLPYVILYVRIIGLRYVMFSLFFPIIGAIRGAGDAMASMVISAINQLIICIPTALILERFFGFAGILWALTLTTATGLTMAAIYYRSRRWEKKAIVSTPRSSIEADI